MYLSRKVTNELGKHEILHFGPDIGDIVFFSSIRKDFVTYAQSKLIICHLILSVR